VPNDTVDFDSNDLLNAVLQNATMDGGSLDGVSLASALDANNQDLNSVGTASVATLEAEAVSTEAVSTESINKNHYILDGEDIADEIDIAESNNRTIILVAPGEYTIDSRLHIPKETSLIGSGIGESVIKSDGDHSVRLDEPNTMLKGFTVETAEENDFGGTVDIRGDSDNNMRIVTECEVRNTAESNGANGINVNDESGSAWIVFNRTTSVMEEGISVRGSADECFVFGNFADSISISSGTKPSPVDDFNHLIL